MKASDTGTIEGNQKRGGMQCCSSYLGKSLMRESFKYKELRPREGEAFSNSDFRPWMNNSQWKFVNHVIKWTKINFTSQCYSNSLQGILTQEILCSSSRCHYKEPKIKLAIYQIKPQFHCCDYLDFNLSHSQQLIKTTHFMGSTTFLPHIPSTFIKIY